jgi:hypothetical protein
MRSKAPTSVRFPEFPHQQTQAAHLFVGPKTRPEGELPVLETCGAAALVSPEFRGAFPSAPSGSAAPKTSQSPDRKRNNETQRSRLSFYTALAFLTSYNRPVFLGM